jgi:hypothetical protein
MMWWPTLTTNNGQLDEEAVEVSDAEVLLEEAMEGDSEPADGISLGSQDSESDAQAARENEERDSSFSSPSHSSSECEVAQSDKSECEVMNTCGKAGSSLLPASQDREEEVLELDLDEQDEQDDNNEQPDSVPANEATRKNASLSSSHDRDNVEENDADSVAARNAKKFKR